MAKRKNDMTNKNENYARDNYKASENVNKRNTSNKAKQNTTNKNETDCK